MSNENLKKKIPVIHYQNETFNGYFTLDEPIPEEIITLSFKMKKIIVSKEELEELKKKNKFYKSNKNRNVE